MNKVRTVLFAEDDQVLLAAYLPHLKRAGYKVIPANDGLETLKNLSMLVPDLLVLDLMMPKFDGEELLQYIANTPRLADMAVIVLSSKCVVDAEHEHLIMYADQYLIKQDCNPNILLKAVNGLLTGRFHAKPAHKIPARPETVPSMVRACQKLHSSR